MLCNAILLSVCHQHRLQRAAIYDALRTTTAGSESSDTHSIASTGRGRGKGSSATDTEASIELPPDVQLPEHGGYVAYFVDAGKLLLVEAYGLHELGNSDPSKLFQ